MTARGDDLAWLFYTSGTTGRPKGAMLTPPLAGAGQLSPMLSEVDAISPGDAILHAAPMSHGSGLYMMAHVARLGVKVMPESGGFEPEEIFALFDAWPRMSMFAAPTMVKRLVDCPRRLRPGKHPHAHLGRRADVCRGRARKRSTASARGWRRSTGKAKRR